MLLILNFRSFKENFKIILLMIFGMQMNSDLFLSSSPNSINCTSSNSWSKARARITCLACANAEGNEKMLFVIGKSINPRFSNVKTPCTLKISYKSSPRAWMNYLIFSSWLKDFDDFASRTRKR